MKFGWKKLVLYSLVLGSIVLIASHFRFSDKTDLQESGPVTTGLLAEYRFDEGIGTNVLKGYNSSQVNDQTLNGIAVSGYEPTWTPQGLKFNNQAISFADSKILNKAKTIILFADIAYPSNELREQYILSGSRTLYIKSDGSIVLRSRETKGVGSYLSPSQRLEGPLAVTFVMGSTNKVYYSSSEVVGYWKRESLNEGNQPVYLGLNPEVKSASYKGTVYYLLIYDTELKESQIARNIAYVTQKLTTRGVKLGDTLGNLPQIICEGDSITFGAGATSGKDWPVTMQKSLTGKYRITNLGISGQKAYEILANAPERTDRLWSLYSATPKVYLLWAGSNDLAEGKTSSVINSLTSRIAAARAAGATKILLGTILPRGDAGFEVNREKINSAIRASGHLGADGIADVAADKTIGQFNQNTDINYYGDGIHPNDAGYQIIAEIWQQALNRAGIK